MKPADIKSSTYTGFNKRNNKEDPKLKVGDQKSMNIKIYKHSNKGLCSKLIWRSFVIKKFNNTVAWAYVIFDVFGEEIVGSFLEKKHETNQKEFRVEKVIQRKSNKLYVKWECYGSFFNNCIDKKIII